MIPVDIELSICFKKSYLKQEFFLLTIIINCYLKLYNFLQIIGD